MQATWLRSLAVTLVVALIAVSCGEETKEDPRIKTVQAYANDCRTQLAAGNYELAKNAAFQVVKGTLLSVNDVSVDQAAFCYTTANTLAKINDVTKNIESQISLVAGLINGGGVSLSPQGLQKLADDYLNGRLDKQTQGAIGLFLDSYLGPIQNLLEENQELLRLIISKKRFNWQIDALPLKIADKELINAGGRYDMGEVYLLYGLTRAILATFYTLQSQDYSINLTIAYYALQVDETSNFGHPNPLLGLFDNPALALSNAVAILMGTSPKFLALDAKTGRDKMKAAGEGFADGFDSILKSVNAMKKRKEGEQAEHIVEYKRENDQDYFVLHMKFTNLVPLVDLQKFDGISIPLRDDVLASLENMAKDFSGASGVNTNLQRDIFPIIALTAVVLINSGAFQALIDLAVASADEKTKDTINQALGLVASNPDLILAALVGVVPVEIEFDFGHIFKNPVGLRDVFPAWIQPNVPVGNQIEYLRPLTMSTIVYSYECADDVDPIITGDILCDTTADAAHFQPADGSTLVNFWYQTDTTTGTWTHPDALWKNFPTNNFGTLWDANVPTPKDGIETGIPYIGWKDATFGGLVYLDVTSINVNGDIEAGNGLKKATLQSFNATIASIVSSVESFLK